jgi:putative transposase
MVNYRRNKSGNPDDIIFITIVTASRDPWIEKFDRYSLLHNEMLRLASKLNFEFKAWAILPDHLHWLICPAANDYSNIVSAVKRGIGAEFKRDGTLKTGGKLWQDRFWESTIKSDEHCSKSVEYIHYNPVKHGLVKNPKEWQYSSFHDFVQQGIYPVEWGGGCIADIYGAEYD